MAPATAQAVSSDAAGRARQEVSREADWDDMAAMEADFMAADSEQQIPDDIPDDSSVGRVGAEVVRQAGGEIVEQPQHLQCLIQCLIVYNLGFI